MVLDSNIGFLKRIKKVLACVCHYCGKLKVDQSDYRLQRIAKMNNTKKFQGIRSIAEPRLVCPVEEGLAQSGCGQRQPIYRLTEKWKLAAHFKPFKDSDGNLQEAKTVEMSAEKTLALFRSITDDDCALMGMDPRFARPDWMILTALPVPPITVRPSVSVDGVGRSEDDLTYVLSNIIKANNQLRQYEANGQPAHVIDEMVEYLQYQSAAMIDNESLADRRATQKSGRPVFIVLIRSSPSKLV